jgi:type IV pilus assembly protein PilB
MDSQNAADLSAQLARLKREGEEREAQRLSQKFGYRYVDLTKVPATVDALGLVPEAVAKEAKMAAVELRARKVAVAVLDPDTPAVKKAVGDLEARKYQVKIFVTSLSGLEQAWKMYRFVKPEAGDITGKVSIEKKRVEELMAHLISFTAIQDEIKKFDFLKTSPVLLIEVILAGALALRASDIHFEAGEKEAKVRFRVDGLLHDVFSNLPPANYNSLVSRFKLLSGLKINVRNISQDGRFTIGVGDKEIEMRVSIIPAEFGETIVMRILDPASTMVSLEALGLRPDDLAIVERQITKPNGLILNTGPTGSGKTTTLYAFLRKMNDPEMKIITLEDPIEYRIEGIEQTQVDSAAGYTFANGLRAVVRQDPDVVLVGEVRDLETADIALQAALTGHLVLSTLHTNDAIGAVPRLMNLGVKAISIGPALNLIIAQRLVRRLCPGCKKAEITGEETKKNIERFLKKLPARVDRSKYENFKIYEPVGCEKCNHIGYRGRVGVFEFLEGGLDLEQVILKEASEISMKHLADSQGMVTMQEDGILKTLAGETSFQEVESATGKIEWGS